MYFHGFDGSGLNLVSGVGRRRSKSSFNRASLTADDVVHLSSQKLNLRVWRSDTPYWTLRVAPHLTDLYFLSSKLLLQVQELLLLLSQTSILHGFDGVRDGKWTRGSHLSVVYFLSAKSL